MKAVYCEKCHAMRPGRCLWHECGKHPGQYKMQCRCNRKRPPGCTGCEGNALEKCWRAWEVEIERKKGAGE